MVTTLVRIVSTTGVFMKSLCRLTAGPTASLPDRLRAEPVDTINHELRTPLTALLGHAELLQDLDLPEAAGRSLDAIILAGERLMTLAATFSRIIDLERAAYDVAPARAELAPIDPPDSAGRSHA